MNLRPILFLPIIFVLFLSPVFAQKRIATEATPEAMDLVGEYIYSSGFVGASYKITGDGRYEYSTFSDCCDPVWAESGTYFLKANLLHFKAITKTLNHYNMLDIKQAAEAYRTIYHSEDADVRAGQVQSEYHMQIVKWGERIYLIEPDKLSLFVAAVNFGIEPRPTIINSNYLATRFFLSCENYRKAVAGKPVLPEPWSSYINAPPIKAAVIKIELEDKKRIYTVDKGTADGLKVGMIMLGDNTEPDYDNLLSVISADEHSATLKGRPVFRAVEYQLGDTLITKTVKDR